MIRISDSSECCGCNACVQRCPQQCIAMHTDAHGFELPLVDESRCVDCHLCERVCPVINQKNSVLPMSVFSAKHNSDAVRMRSSSGGIFSLLAEHVLEWQGVVFGARFDSQWNVIHDFIESMDDLHLFRGSKYVQSQIGDCFIKAEQFLQQGRQVLFSGTPCQIAGLSNFLGKDYDNLLKVDIVCHGVPSPKVWSDYLASLKIKDIQSIDFRNKDLGWKTFSLKVTGRNQQYAERFDKDCYFDAFLRNFSLRPSCYSCPAKASHTQSDITLGDFWGISDYDAEIDDDKGVSVVLVNSVKGEQVIQGLNNGVFKPMEFDMAIASNSAITQSVAKNEHVDKFWQRYQDRGIKGMKRFLKKTRKPKLTVGVLLDILKWKIINMLNR